MTLILKDLENQSFGGGEEMENAGAEDDFNFEKQDINFHALTPNDVEQLEFKIQKQHIHFIMSLAAIMVLV